MTASAWEKTLLFFEENSSVLLTMPPSPPISSAKLWRDSAHGTLGHLTACQAAWIHLIRGIKVGDLRGSVPTNPDPLYRKLGYNKIAWEFLIERFVTDRTEWRQILCQVDVTQEIHTAKRNYSAQTLTKRMVDHERAHLADLSSAAHASTT